MEKFVISGDRKISHQDILQNAAKAARGLEEECGISVADSVAIFMRNDFAFFEMSLAAAALGAYSVPVNWHYTADEANYVLTNCGAKALIIHADLLPNIADGIPEGCKVFVVETPPELQEAYQVSPEAALVPTDQTGWYDWIKHFDPLEPRDISSPGAMIYTSGTTGRPKGVRRKSGTPEEMDNLYATINQAFDIGPGKRTIIPAPLYHSAPNTYGILCVVMGMDEMVLMPRFDPEELLRLVEKHKTTHLQTVPTMFIRMLKLPEEERAKYNVSSLEFVVHAAAPCPPDIKQQMIDWWGPIINEYYGATEVGAVSFLDSNQWLGHRGSVGKAMKNCEIVILDDEGRRLPANEIGDVYCRNMGGPDFTYHLDDEKRNNAEAEGLISVGDIGYLDEDGFLYLCDRRNDMVISGGVNIYPAEIEACLISHPAVADCAVFGIPDDDFGESLCACVQVESGQNLLEDEVRSHVREFMAGYKVPKVVDIRKDLPREDSGKIFKRKLREPYWQEKGRSI